MLATAAIPLHSITVTASTNQQPLTTNGRMGDSFIHHTVMGTDEGNSYLDDKAYAKYSGRYIPIDTTWQVCVLKAHQGH